MKIGLTYDLQADYLALGYSKEAAAEFDELATIEALEEALKRLGYRTYRLGNIYQLGRYLVDLKAGASGVAGAPPAVDLIFNICEGVRGFGREAAVPALLDAYGIPYTFSDPLICSLTLHKAWTKKILQRLQLPTPSFLTLATKEEIASLTIKDTGELQSSLLADLPANLRLSAREPLFLKPVAEGTSKGIHQDAQVKDLSTLKEVALRLLQAHKQPVLVEQYLSGREFTVGILGAGRTAEVVAVLEIELLATAEAGIYTFTNKKEYRERVAYRLAEDALARRARELALAAWRGLGCLDAGRVDLRADAAGDLQIIELNPLPGLHPQDSDLPIMCQRVGLSYLELIKRIVDAAKARYGLR